MDNKFYLLAAMTITLVQVGAAFLVVSDRGTFIDDTGRKCKLEHPNSTIMDNLPFSATELIPGENVSRSVEFMALSGVFNYIGCVKIKSISPSTSTIVPGIPREPGLCYSACKTDVVGLSYTKCYCFQTQPSFNVSGGNCYQECSHPSGTTCGHPRDEYASLYKTAPSYDVGKNDGRFCRLYNDTSKSLNWENCKHSHIGLCYNERLKTQYPYSITWVQYILRCSPPKSYKHYNFNINNTDSWMATIQSHIFLKCINTPTTSGIVSATSQHLIIAIYTAVPVLVLMVICGLTCFLVRKRRKHTQRGNYGSRKGNTDLHGTDRSDEETSQQNQGKQRYTNEQNDNTPGSHFHKQADMHNPDDTYDHAGFSVGVKYHADISVHNVYDSCVKTSDETYDHTGVSLGIKRQTAGSVQNVYDSCDKMSGDTYDHSGVSVVVKGQTDGSVQNVNDSCWKLSDDTYDHTGISVDVKRSADVSVESAYDSCV